MLTRPAANPTGAAICANVIQSNILQHARRVGAYVHCAKLCEVDTSVLVDHLLSGTLPGNTLHLCETNRLPETSHTRCYVPVVRDSSANMQLLHLGALARLQHEDPATLKPQTPCKPCSRCRHSASSNRPIRTATATSVKMVCAYRSWQLLCT